MSSVNRGLCEAESFLLDWVENLGERETTPRSTPLTVFDALLLFV